MCPGVFIYKCTHYTCALVVVTLHTLEEAGTWRLGLIPSPGAVYICSGVNGI